MGIDKKFPVLRGDKIVIENLDALKRLGYEKDCPEMLAYAGKAYTVKKVEKMDSGRRLIHVCEEEVLFVDADIAGVFRTCSLS